jgi:radical SAM superfamily enzyme YgiQ (UPF0313 family)
LSITRAILETTTYSDVFDYPLTASEIHRYLTGERASLEEVTIALQGMDRITNLNGYYVLAGREILLETRNRRREISLRLWIKARRYGRILAALPFVRLVGVTGSLAMNNADENKDIDYMLVTAPGWLWTCRAMSIVVLRFAKLEGVTLCPNYLVTENALELTDRSLYVARELAQMVPLAGMDIYEQLRRLNPWVDDYLPNAQGVPESVILPTGPRENVSEAKDRRINKFFETMLKVFHFQWFERWEMNRKIKRLSREQASSPEASFSPDVCKGHMDKHGQKTALAIQDKLEQIALESDMNKILLGQSYFLRFDPKLWDAMQPYPPLGTLYAASYLRKHGYDVALFDAMLAESEEEWEAALRQHQPEFAVLYEDNFNYLSKMCLLNMREAAFKMIDMAKRRGCTVILCGADATDHAEEYLARGADYVLLGEGEETLVELLSQLSAQSETSPESILGLAYKVNETPHRNPRRPDIKDLDALPFPAWDLVDVEKYRAIWVQHHGYFSMNMVTTRGCPFHCNWCAKPIWGQRYHSRSPENVAAEMKWLKENYKPDHIWFADDILGLKPGWLRGFANAVNEMGALIPFKCLSRADLLTREGEVDSLARAGAQTVWMGAESGSQKVLDAMDKGTRVEQIHKAAQLLKGAGIRVAFFLQFGYPGETREDIERTIQLVRDADPDDIGISVSYAMPGTKFFDNVREQLGEKQNWQDSQDLAMLYRGPFSTDFYRKLHAVIHKEFRARKAWQAFKRGPRFYDAARMSYNLFTLPVAKLQLNSLASRSQIALSTLPHMSHEAAATPSPQEER